MTEKRKITVQEILRMLDEGKSRKEINKYFQLNPREIKEVWKHPSLANKKPAKHTIGVILVDEDLVDENSRKENINSISEF